MTNRRHPGASDGVILTPWNGRRDRVHCGVESCDASSVPFLGALFRNKNKNGHTLPDSFLHHDALVVDANNEPSHPWTCHLTMYKVPRYLTAPWKLPSALSAHCVYGLGIDVSTG